MKDDVISRRAAIDALMEFDKKLRKINWYQYPYTEHECRGVDEAIVKIANLPSAQPEAIVYCGECVHMMPNGRCRQFADESIRPSASDYCSAGERRTDERSD